MTTRLLIANPNITASRATRSPRPSLTVRCRVTRFSMVGLVAVLAVTAACSAGSGEATADQSDLNQQLLVAAWDNDVPLARRLIADGADVNHKDQTVQSAYLVATSEGYLQLLELTLDNGADVTSLDSFNGTGLIRSAERGHADIVERLLETDIDVNHINNLGWTALHEAIILGDGSDRYVRTVRLLVDHGADLALPTGDGQTPLDLADRRGQTAIVELLLAGNRSPEVAD